MDFQNLKIVKLRSQKIIFKIILIKKTDFKKDYLT
jgi:hypothetical protein